LPGLCRKRGRGGSTPLCDLGIDVDHDFLPFTKIESFVGPGHGIRRKKEIQNQGRELEEQQQQQHPNLHSPRSWPVGMIALGKDLLQRPPAVHQARLDGFCRDAPAGGQAGGLAICQNSDQLLDAGQLGPDLP
jgi:hypothetical protein